MNRIVTEDGRAMVTVTTGENGVTVSIYHDRVWERDSADPESYREVQILIIDQQTDAPPDKTFGNIDARHL